MCQKFAWPRDESKTLAAAAVVPGNTLTAVIAVPWLNAKVTQEWLTGNIGGIVKDKRTKTMLSEPKAIHFEQPSLYDAETTMFIPSRFHSDVALRHQRPKMKRALLKQRRVVAS